MKIKFFLRLSQVIHHLYLLICGSEASIALVGRDPQLMLCYKIVIIIIIIIIIIQGD